MPEPDFDQIARRLIGLIDPDGAEEDERPVDDLHRQAIANQLAAVAAQLRQVWNAGKEAGGQHETFVNHLKDENNAAHQALDRLDTPKTKWVPSRNYDGGTQEITIGLADRIDAARRQVWNARGAADRTIVDQEWREDLDAAAIGRAIQTLDR